MRPVTVSTPDEIRRWPATVDVPTAGLCWGLGRIASYRAAREGRFPVQVLRLGRRLVVTRASVLAALGITESAAAAPGMAHASDQKALLSVPASDIRSEGRASTEAA